MTGTFELDLNRGSVVRMPFSLPVHLTLREAGDMGPSGAATQPLRDEVLRGLGIDPADYITVRQVHSRDVAVVGQAARPGPDTAADGLLTNDRRLALGVTVADCMPIFLHDPGTGAFAALHSGWRGTGIVSDAVRLMESRYGVAAENIEALLGPSIRSCCYRVDESRAALFRDLWGERALVWREDGPYLDLVRPNIDLLEAHGVRRVSVAQECTGCTSTLGSFRREGAEHFTRMMAVIQGE
ncbi:MAG: polyphenol oxidase family protein [Spirochaetaceae bacterium]